MILSLIINHTVIVKFDFIKCNEIHNYETRNSCKGDLYLDTHKTNYYEKSLCYQGAKFYNMIPCEIRNAISEVCFKKKLKIWLFNNNSTL